MLLSSDGAENTIIDGSNSGTVIDLNDNNEIIISGFTIQNGYRHIGAGIRATVNNYVLISNCINGQIIISFPSDHKPNFFKL